MSDQKPYNPLDKKNLGKSVAEALLEQKYIPLENIETFLGAGIYAIYYHGNFLPYSLISATEIESKLQTPIYIGKAVPLGARKGQLGLDLPAGRVLHGRLKEHADSIKAATNLELSDFMCRFLVVDDIWIPLGESLLVSWFSPIWNTLIDGFGNHDPGKGRYEQTRSRWDTLHPGRNWATKVRDRAESAAEIESDVTSFLRNTLR